MFIPLGDDVDNKTLPIVGIVLVIINFFGFLETTRLTFQDPTGEQVMEVYQNLGLVPAELAQGRVLPILTHMFLHAGFMHFLGNMIVLWAFVRTLENAMGSLNFLGFYIFWGVIAGLSESAAHWGGDVPLVGASGAIAGVIGAYCVGFGALTNIKTLFWLFGPRRVNVPAGLYIFLWLLGQFDGLASEDGEGVAWFAHLGGFAAGYLTMRLIGKQTKRRLIEGKDGILTFEENPEAAEGAEGSGLEVDPLEKLPECCPVCGETFREEDVIAPSLMRCPNDACRRLHYASPTPAAVPAGKR